MKRAVAEIILMHSSCARALDSELECRFQPSLKGHLRQILSRKKSKDAILRELQAL